MKKFWAHEYAIKIVVEMSILIVIVRRYDRSLADQLKRAGASILLNVGEGNRRRGGDRIQHFLIAMGSAQETRDALTIAVAWRYLAADSTDKALALIDSEIAMLCRLTHPRA